jgi:hypothetical protein
MGDLDLDPRLANRDRKPQLDPNAPTTQPTPDAGSLQALQSQAGNLAVSRMLAGRAGNGSTLGGDSGTADVQRAPLATTDDPTAKGGPQMVPEQTVVGQPPVNPAMSAMFNAAVATKITRASLALTLEPPDPKRAIQDVIDAQGVTFSLANAYEGRDDLLFNELLRLANGLNAIAQALGPAVGLKAENSEIAPMIASMDTLSGDLVNRLH